MILVSLENVKKCVLGGCTITTKTKINVVWRRGRSVSKKFQTTLILAFEANSALSRENETKIVKITHSAGNADDAAGGQHLDSIILWSDVSMNCQDKLLLTYLLVCQVTLLHIWHANGSHRQPRMLMATFSIWCLNYSTVWWLPHIYDSQL